MRERGLKLVSCGLCNRRKTSLPMRERGLKPNLIANNGNALVAPHAGAWMETLDHAIELDLDHVAPHAGAWIETGTLVKYVKSEEVAPHAGAWIETKGS